MAKSRVHKYEQLKRQLVAQIASGQWTPGMRLPTERQLMAMHGVSYSTVSRAIKELELCGLIDRQWGSGTFVRKAQQSKTLAVTFDNCYQVSHPFMQPLLTGLETAGRQHGWSMQLFPLSEHRLLDGSAFERMLTKGMIQGVIGCSTMLTPEINELVKMQIPFVSINHAHQGQGVSHVMIDAAKTVADTLDYLVGLDHENLALIVGPEVTSSDQVPTTSSSVVTQWKQQMQARNLQCPRHHILHSDYHFDSIEYYVRGMLSTSQGPTAIVVIDDNLALQTVLTAEAMGLVVPDDVSIFSIGDVLADSRLTNYRLPFKQYGVRAIELLDQLLLKQTPEPILFPGELIVRQTCGKVRTVHKPIAAASTRLST